jgi:hypothetical protein
VCNVLNVWSEFLATDPGVRVRFPELPDFLGGGGSEAGSTQLRECGWGAAWRTGSTAVGIRRAGHVAPSIRGGCDWLRRRAAVARSVWLARGLGPRSLVYFLVSSVLL